MKLLQLDKCHQKNSKRGGMLVIVLMIFAVALILISSAMTITLSSRSRYYVDAERSQERLTLTCAAEAVIDAVETQEITDEQLIAMSKNPTKPYEITGASKTTVKDGATATKGYDIAPGLTGEDGSRTYMYVKPAGGSSEDLILEFSTRIDVTGEDTKSENLTVYLEHFDPPKVNICANMVTLGDPNSNNQVNRIWATGNGYTGQAGSFMVFHGDVDLTNEAYSRTPVVFTGKVATGGAGTYFKNDVILYGKDATLDSTKSYGNGMQIGNNNTGSDLGGVFFLGVGCENSTQKQQIFSSPITGWNYANITTYGAFFYHAEGDLKIESTNSRGIETAVMGQGANITTSNMGNSGTYFTKVNLKTDGANWKNQDWEIASTAKGGSVTASNDEIAQRTEKINQKAKAYLQSSSLETAAKQKMPSPDAYQTKFIDDPSEGFLASSDTTYITGNEGTLPAGKYEMYGTYGGGRVLNIDLKDGNATIYMSENTKFEDFRLNVSNKSGNKLYIIIEAGKTFEMTYNAQGMTGGLSSCDLRRASIEGARSSCNFNIQNYELYGQMNGVDYRPQAGQKPAAVVIGLGSNTFKVDGGGCVCDAYVSLAGEGTSASTFSVTGNALFYGRFESDKFESNSNPIGLDYCPSLDSQDDPDKPLATRYRAKSYSYHY